MSFLRLRSLQQVRSRFSSSIAAEEKAIEEHARQTAVQWKWISALVGMPVCGYLFVKHIVFSEHEDLHGDHIDFAHMRIRKTQFPWGEESLFHSKHNYSPNQTFLCKLVMEDIQQSSFFQYAPSSFGGIQLKTGLQCDHHVS